MFFLRSARRANAPKTRDTGRADYQFVTDLPADTAGVVNERHLRLAVLGQPDDPVGLRTARILFSACLHDHALGRGARRHPLTAELTVKHTQSRTSPAGWLTPGRLSSRSRATPRGPNTD
jgi:hypothetical protein